MMSILKSFSFFCCSAVFFVSVWLMSFSVQGASLPQFSPYDSRMQNVNYNALNTTVVNVRLGFLTTVVFGNDETVLAAKSGFEGGWDITTEGNKVFITPRPAVQEQEVINDSGDKERVVRVFEPSPTEWNTNLFVTSNKRDYSLELKLVSPANRSTPSVFVLNYLYPDEKRERESSQLKAANEKKLIAQKLEAGEAPRNWNYHMRVGKDSQSITPDFAYDDGEKTYLGFAPQKVFPSAFLYVNEKEQVVNMSVRQKGNYKIMIIHDLSNSFVLRHGDQVVGIINLSYAQSAAPYKNTSSREVERVEVLND